MFVFALTIIVLGSVVISRRSDTEREEEEEKEEIEEEKERVLRVRKRTSCGAQSISYENSDPFMAMRGEMQYLYDEKNIAYLDTRNNVGHVGWQHPKWCKAVRDQLETFNANSRYIHPRRAELAQKLLAKFPSKLCKVFFVNSGSEANDLALRLAKTHTKHQDVICVERGYHGHTMATLAVCRNYFCLSLTHSLTYAPTQISPYKTHMKGISNDWVHTVSCPDMFRGAYAHLNEKDAAEKYANQVREACKKSQNIAAFFVESGMSVAGVILPPQGYLKQCYSYVHKAGGVCIADEVQVGFGRFGTSFWGFEQQNVVPDIVTMGKPFGNGFPLAAVVTTEEISRSFENGVEYFNTFGGNPVSLAAGIAVLDIIEKEKLQDRAKACGDYIQEQLKLMMKHEKRIGDVRGSGLFIGIEFVKSTNREPNTALTSILCSRLKNRHNILTSIDGFFDNVIVIKPPMCFNVNNADFFLEKMRVELSNITEKDLKSYTHTPT
jgi:ethanolamine-phosphate phospho-lyase